MKIAHILPGNGTMRQGPWPSQRVFTAHHRPEFIALWTVQAMARRFCHSRKWSGFLGGRAFEPKNAYTFCECALAFAEGAAQRVSYRFQKIPQQGLLAGDNHDFSRHACHQCDPVTNFGDLFA